MAKHKTAPVGGKILTKPMKVLLGLYLVSAVLMTARYFTGLGAVTDMSDRYPWGIWIAFDVVTGTALACGGYAVAILVYILNKGKFHPLIRSAIVTSALGYTLGGACVVLDLGRWWNVWKVPTHFWHWNFNSILLEVALCIMAYTAVLWLELAPAFLEKFQEAEHPALRKFARLTLPSLENGMPFIVALGLLLPTMHQSSLGTLMMLAGYKVHPLWQTPMLPLLFLISCVCMGYGAVVLESSLSARFFKLPRETEILRRLGNVVAPLLLAYVVARVGDLVVHGKTMLMFTSGGYSLLFLIEMALFITPIVMIYRQPNPKLGYLFRAAMLIVFAGALYRFSTFLIAFRPAQGWVYFPSVIETVITLGLIAGEIAGYIFIVKKFPILRGTLSQLPVGDLDDSMISTIPTPSAAPAGGD